MNKKLKLGLLITLIIIILITIIGSLFYSKKNPQQSQSNAVILFFTDSSDKQKYYLSSDLEYDYYLNNHSPMQVYVLIKENNQLSNAQIDDYISEFKKLNKTKYEDENVKIDTLMRQLNKGEIEISDVTSQIEIIKIKNTSAKYTLKSSTFFPASSYTLYYTDKNDVKIYTKGIKTILFEDDNNEVSELKDLLKKNDDSFYQIFNRLKSDNKTIIFYDSDDDILQSIVKDNIQITLKIVEDKLTFYIEKCTKKVINDIA